MSVLWITFTLAILVYHCHAAGKDIREKEEKGPQECTPETCGPNLRPIPMVRMDKLQGEAKRERLHEDRYPHGRDKIQTAFHCEGKPYIPGFYADMEADCKIFHICFENFVEHYMCPGNTSFDQRSLVCKPVDDVKCHLTPEYYVMNANIRPGHPIVPGTKEFALNQDSEKWLYDLVKGDREQFNASDEDALERSLIRMLILMQFVDVSDVVAGILAEEESHGDIRQERAVNASQLTEGVLDNILNEIFRLLPVKFSSDPRTPVEQADADTESSEQKTPKNDDSLWGDFQENNPQPEERSYNISGLGTSHNETTSEPRRERKGRTLGSPGLSKHPSRKALKIIELLLLSIGKKLGKLSLESRSYVVWNYIKYLNALSAGLLL